MKSFENINILKIEVKIFCMKNDFFLQKKLLFETKKIVTWSKNFLPLAPKSPGD